MHLRLEVAARTETLKLDDTTTFTLSGQLLFVADDDSEPHVMGQITFPVPEKVYIDCAPGNWMRFDYDPGSVG